MEKIDTIYLNFVDEPILILNDIGIITYHNKKAEEFFNQPVISRPLTDFLDSNIVSEALEKAKENNKAEFVFSFKEKKIQLFSHGYNIF